MLKRLSSLLPIAFIAIIPTFLIWLPFLLRISVFWNIPLRTDGMATIVSNYDGPLFLVVAKTFYNPNLIKSLYQFPLPTEYYSAHFPAFPLLIKIFAPILGSPYSMLSITIASSFLAIYFFRKLALEFVSQEKAMWLTAVFSVFPARWLIVRSVGSAEPLFLAGIIASFYFFRKKRYLLAGLWGALAQLTKSPGILLFVAYLAAIVVPQLKYLAVGSIPKWFNRLNFTKIYPIFLIPLSLLLLFIFYGFTYNDFFTYFHSGDNIHLFFPPFQIFNYSAPWVGTFWLEEVIFVYLFGAYGLLKLIEKREYEMAYFVGIFFASILFVAHRDVIRYALPILPFLLIAYSDTLVKKEFKFVLAILILPIYLYSLSYISQNTMPISDWAPFL